MSINIGGYGEFAYLLPGFLTHERCDNMIQIAEEHGWTPALINRGGGSQIYKPEIRKCDRAMVIDDNMAAQIFDEIKAILPQGAIKLNPMFRFLKYESGDYFKPHHDGMYRDDEGNESNITVQIYLNDGYNGGETLFYTEEYYGQVVAYTHIPKRGDILLFDQSLLHEGAILKSGTKLCVRTEVMYSGN
jgi:prolyl 4-hydroxylase